MNDEKIKKTLERLASEQVPDDVRALAEQTSQQFVDNLTTSKPHISWSMIMESRITKLAAAAVITIAVLFGLGRFFDGSVTFAQVIEPILNARTVVCDCIIGEDENSPVIHDIVVGNRIRRTLSNMDTIMILDLDNAKMLTLDPKTKGAVYMDIQGLVQEGTKNILGIVRNIVSDLKEHPDSYEDLGKSKIDGRQVVGFLVRSPNNEMTIWADPTNAKPVRIELLVGRLPYIIRNIEFDVSVDGSLVSMEPPEGYTLAGMEFNLTQFTEQDFVESLRIWAGLIFDGSFPETLTAESYMKAVPLLGEKLGQSNLSKEEGSQFGMTFGRGLMFFQVTAMKSRDWHYAGNSVKLGQADRAVFWYQPKDSDTYRVIYGDLSIKDVLPQDLPK